jgi:hypothetical protein
MAEIEKIASGNGGRYRIRSHDQILTVDAQGLKDIYEYALAHRRELEQEAKGDAVQHSNEDIVERNP